MGVERHAGARHGLAGRAGTSALERIQQTALEDDAAHGRDEHGLQAGDSIGNRDRLEHAVHGEIQTCRAFVLLSHGGVKGSVAAPDWLRRDRLPP